MLKNTNLNLKTICHTRPDRVSRGMIFNNKEYYTAGSSGRADACPRMTEECGRSMVEMLGVLAVMGVLSVAGIAGYTSAMNKHRANELLNEASKRAVVIVPQIAAGNMPSIAEFTNNDLGYGTFVSTVYGENGTDSWDASTDKKFVLSITGVSEAVCNQMKNAKGGVIKDFKPDTCASGNGNNVKLTYNNDMSTADVASNADPTAPCSGHGYKDSNDDCVCDPGYSDTNCATAACTTGTYCGSGATKECCATDEVCTTSGDVAGTCVKNSSGCTTNGSCIGQTVGATTCTSENCYCKLENTEYNCDAPNKGTCTTLDAGRETTYTDPNDTTKTKTFLVSSGSMSWWAADNWCKAHNKKLVSYSTANSLFDCDKDEANDYDSPSCTWSKFTTASYWSNGTLSDYYWTAESYDSCYAWGFEVGYGGFNFGRSGNLYALCE